MGRFPTTSWSMVVAAGAKPSVDSREALSELCQAYWKPVYEFVVYQGHPEEDARDLTQEFFARLIDKNYAGQADRERGRFRSFLLAAVTHFLASQARGARAKKRGGGHKPVSLDAGTENGTPLQIARDDLTPEKIFERRWALSVIEHALAGLHGITHFEQLKQFIAGGAEPSLTYSAVAVELGMSVGAVKTAVHRLRKRFGQLLRAEVGRTVESDSRIEEELRYLLAAIQN
jgi:RNA polymerase sigma factor (sigma-70 family)